MAAKYLDYAGLQRLVQNINEKCAPISALVFKSTVADIASLPALNGVKAGWMYSVTTGGGTTSDFIEGAGHVLGDGENVAAVELITGYEAIATPQATDDPKALGWYESDGAIEPTYTLSNDRIPVAGKTYYAATTVKKWDILGGVFDLEGKYLEFGKEFPQGPATRMIDGRTFLYMGANKVVYTAVVSPEGRPADNGYAEGTFTAVADTSAIVNPKQVPLYEAGENNTYVRTTDITVSEGKTYYTGVFTPSTDTVVNPEKVYYTDTALYTKAGIYEYNATTAEWEAQSAGGSSDMIPITNKEVDDLFI